MNTNAFPKIFLAADHAGYKLKEHLKGYLLRLGYEVEDMGAFEYDDADDYTDFVSKVAATVSEDPDPERVRGIILGGSGQGEAIVANRFPYVRAVVFNGQYTPEDGRIVPNEIEISRTHNDSNILSLGARFLKESEAEKAALLWLTTPFSGEERHVRRIEKIETFGRSLSTEHATL